MIMDNKVAYLKSGLSSGHKEVYLTEDGRWVRWDVSTLWRNASAFDKILDVEDKYGFRCFQLALRAGYKPLTLEESDKINIGL